MVKIEKINNKIIIELLNNCRQSNIQIGKKVGLSREGVANRIKKMEKEGIIKGYGIDVNFSKLGFIPHEVSIKFGGLNSEDEKKIIDFSNKNKKIIFAERSLGKFDYLLMFMVKSIAELDVEIDELRSTFKFQIKKINVSVWSANYDTMSSFFTDNPLQVMSKHEVDAKIHKLDKLELKLLHELANNSIESAVNLAEKLKVSAITVANKLRILSKAGVIKKFTAHIDFEKFGVHRYLILLSINDKNIENRLSEYCRNYKQISDLTKFIGEYNYTIEIFAKDNSEFRKVINDLFNTFRKSIIEYETLILLDEIKHIPFYE